MKDRFICRMRSHFKPTSTRIEWPNAPTTKSWSYAIEIAMLCLLSGCKYTTTIHYALQDPLNNANKYKARTVATNRPADSAARRVKCISRKSDKNACAMMTCRGKVDHCWSCHPSTWSYIPSWTRYVTLM